MEFHKTIRNRRLELGLGVRETARLTHKPYIPSPVGSAVYVSRIENGESKYMPVESITIDKLWGIGCVLRMNPMELFLSSRKRDDLLPRLKAFGVRDCEPQDFGKFVSGLRRDLDLSIRVACSKSHDWDLSVGYWSQVETNFKGYSAKISGGKLWGIGAALDVDPLLLYVLSRGIDPRYLKSVSRDRLFE